jgi:uncharacterized protein YdhG (YjbR/CyaY superfamily)
MENTKNGFTTIDEYIHSFPPEIQEILFELREAVRSAAPNAEEKISYRMPAFYFKGVLVYFAAFKNHIGLYATPTANPEFQKELSRYKTGKGSIQFPIDEPLPLKLICKIVKFRVQENIERDREKMTTSTKKATSISKSKVNKP